MPHNRKWPVKFNSGVQILCLLIGIYGNLCLSLQTHRGSSQTNEFLLNGRTPDAYVQVDSNNKNVVVISVQAPSLSPGQPPFKVGLEMVTMKLCDANDRLKIVYSDSTSIRTVTWKLNASNPSDPRDQLVDLQVNQIVLIPEGKWVMASGVALVATLYQDSMEDGSCPENTVPCSCISNQIQELELAPTSRFSAEITPVSNETGLLKQAQIQNITVFQEAKIRCIPRSLVCNGNPNCGLTCNDDEASSTCPSSTFTSPMSSFPTVTSCDPVIISTTTPGNVGDSGSSAKMIVSSVAMIIVYSSVTMLFNTM